MAEDIFDSHIASTYDKDHEDRFDPQEIDATCRFLKNLAGRGKALEFAIGTGRVALPLQKMGIDVSGIELSQAMISQLRKKDGENSAMVICGDMLSTRVEGEFSLVYLVYNTITNVLSQQEQVECFCNASRHLQSGGFFVIEDLVPPIQDISRGSDTLAFCMSDNHMGIDQFDFVRQLVTSNHVYFRDGKVERFNSTHRYAWPSEYDLMARIAGMALFERWSDWERSPFTAHSQKHISVWRKLDSVG